MRAEQLGAIMRAFAVNHPSLVRRVIYEFGEAIQKAHALAWVAQQDELSEDEREALWRNWCAHTRSSVTTSDIARVREARPRDRQTSLFD